MDYGVHDYAYGYQGHGVGDGRGIESKETTEERIAKEDKARRLQEELECYRMAKWMKKCKEPWETKPPELNKEQKADGEVT